MAHEIPASDQTEPAFTTVLLAMIADYVDSHGTEDAKPHITRMEDNRFLWQTGKVSMSVTINDVSREYMIMGTRINVAKPKDDDNTPRCHCGNKLPCHRHTGDDGDEQDMYTSDDLRGNEGNRDN